MIGDKIKNKRKELNLTQEYLAKELNISRQVVSKWGIGLICLYVEKIFVFSEEYKQIFLIFVFSCIYTV